MPIKILTPSADAKFSIQDAVEFTGTFDDRIKQLKVSSGGASFPEPTISEGKWRLKHRPNIKGEQLITVAGFDINNSMIEQATLKILIEVPDYAKLVPIPRNINNGVTRAKHPTMMEIFGKPGELSDDCLPITNARLKRLMVVENVGPFKVEAIKPAVAALKRIFALVKQQEPELFKTITSGGGLCCRRIRRRPGQPKSRNFSNHSWGTALDLKIKGALDPRGDAKTQLGLLLLHPFFNAEKFFWGAGFSGKDEDAMHFEASDELVRQWNRDGVLNV